jgi:predicted transcriptional regulator
MSNFNSLLFELSSEDRINILMLLRKTPLKLSHISRKLNFTVQETSRNLNRLLESELVIKNVDGTFSLTPYGEAAFGLLSGYKFLFKNRKYFANHSVLELPALFRSSLGVLDGFELVDDVMIVFHNIETMIQHAKDFIWILSDQILASTIPYLVEGLERGLEFKLLMPNDYVPSDDMRELVSNPVFEKASRTKILEARFVDAIKVFLCVSEKEVSALAFLNSHGELDYKGFKTENISGIEWVKILFTYYWNKSTSQIPKQLIQ